MGRTSIMVGVVLMAPAAACWIVLKVCCWKLLALKDEYY